MRFATQHTSAGAGPDDRLDDSPDLPDIHLHPGSAGPAQGLRVQPHSNPTRTALEECVASSKRRVRPRLRLGSPRLSRR